MEYAAEQLVNGLTVGSAYALLAVGYTLVYGVLRFINFAHGEFFMAGAVVGYLVAERLPPRDLPPGMAVVIGIILPTFVGGAAGAILAAMSQAWVYRPIRGEGRRTAVVAVAIALGYVVFVWSALARLGWLVAALVLVAVIGMVLCFGPRRFDRNVACRTRGDPVMPLLAALGLSLALQHGTAALISSDPRAWPELLVMYSWEELDASATAPAGLYVFGPGGGKEVVCRAGESVPPPGLARQGRKGLFANRRPSLQTSQWLIVIALIASGAGLFALVRFTRAGKAMRALSWDPEVARLMGVRPDRTYTFAFLVGGFLAGVAGVLWAMRYGRIDPYMGQLRGLKAFVAAVIGGRGSVPGAILGGLLLGLIETIAASSGFSGQRDALAFVVLILVLLVRPHGLLGRPEGEKV